MHAHIPKTDGPLLSSIDHCNTTTLLTTRYTEPPIKEYADSAVETQYHFTVFTYGHSLSHFYCFIGPPVINHTSFKHHYTKSVSHIEECTYTHDRHPPIHHTSLEHHYTKSMSHIEECTYTHGRCTSLDI